MHARHFAIAYNDPNEIIISVHPYSLLQRR